MSESIARHRGLSALQHPVVAIGLGLVALQILLRGWAVLSGWFYADDFEFLDEANQSPLSWSYLMSPHDSQLMPAGRLLAWWIADSGTYNWVLAATLILLCQLVASLACWWMLCTLVGPRDWALIPLAIYLFSAMTITAYMWWAAAINMVPLHAALFLAIGCHTRYLRDRRVIWMIAATLSIAVGLLFYVKALLILIPVTFLTFAYFRVPADSWGASTMATVRRYWPAVVSYGAVAAGYLIYYLRHVPNPVSADVPIAYGDLADAMFRTSMGPTILGGPWVWSIDNPPLGQVATPAWVITVAWVVLSLWAIGWLRGRYSDWRPLLLAVMYMAVSFFLVARGRGTVLGGFAGLELRYLADSLAVMCLALALFLVPIRRQANASAERDVPSIRTKGLRSYGAALMAIVMVGSLYSTVRYMTFWTGGYPAEQFVRNVMSQAQQSRLVVADEVVPEIVMPFTSYPSNLPSRLLSSLSEDQFSARTAGTNLDMLDGLGTAEPAFVPGGAVAEPGPVRNCGYRLTPKSPVRVRDFVGDPEGYFWWLQISYLASDDGNVIIDLPSGEHTMEVRAGVNNYFVRGEGGYRPMAISTEDAGLKVCVDRVAVGTLTTISNR